MGYLFEEPIELCVTLSIGNENDLVLLSLPAYTTLFGLDQVNSNAPIAIHISSRPKVLDIDQDLGLTCWCRLDEKVRSLRSSMAPLTRFARPPVSSFRRNVSDLTHGSLRITLRLYPQHAISILFSQLLSPKSYSQLIVGVDPISLEILPSQKLRSIAISFQSFVKAVTKPFPRLSCQPRASPQLKAI